MGAVTTSSRMFWKQKKEEAAPSAHLSTPEPEGVLCNCASDPPEGAGAAVSARSGPGVGERSPPGAQPRSQRLVEVPDTSPDSPPAAPVPSSGRRASPYRYRAGRPPYRPRHSRVPGARGGAGPGGGRARRVPGARRSAVPPPHRAPQLQQAGAQRGPRPVACVWERACGRGSRRPRGGRVCSGEAWEGCRRAGPTDRHSDRRPLRHPARRPGPLRAAALRGGRRGWQCLRAHARSQTHTPGPRHRHTTRTDPRPAAAHTRTRAHARSPAQAPQQPLPRRRWHPARIPAGTGEAWRRTVLLASVTSHLSGTHFGKSEAPTPPPTPPPRFTESWRVKEFIFSLSRDDWPP
ncbi:serine/arginine repetitive matrix protein 2-like [Onychomys torridus]|uniref:serine/arginine repetitive matrix protein 2-like n=1 Tax=Onychomys torridus TaxID=38674 RepID=UPI00167FB23C|nr:serine/arginine repetitive matrix protein 2-like [Onychomys torridus]